MSNTSKEPLTIERIVQAALSLLDSHGVKGLSMRRLGAKINVEAASLYHHIPNRESLIQNIIDTVSVEAVSTDGGPMPWPQTLYTYAKKYREALVMHPGVVPLAAIHPISAEAGAKLSAPLLEAMRKAKVDQEQALFIIQSIAVFVIGHALAEVGNWPDESTAPKRYYDQWFEMGISALINGFKLNN